MTDDRATRMDALERAVAENSRLLRLILTALDERQTREHGAGTARPPAPTTTVLHWPSDEERARVRALNAAAREARQQLPAAQPRRADLE